MIWRLAWRLSFAVLVFALASPLAEANNEYPVKEGVPWSPLVKSWGDFKPHPISLNEIAALRKKASELIDKVGFDDGPST